MLDGLHLKEIKVKNSLV